MKKPERIIIWSKFVGPRPDGRSQIEYVPEKDIEVNQFDINPYDRHDYDEDDQEVDSSQPQPVIVTDFGVLPLRPYNNIVNFFNLWTGETNFNLSEKIGKILNEAEGVEALDIFSRYRFRVAIGNAFSFQDVRQNIEKSLGVVPKKNKSLV
jgi:hypothetical protein